VSSSAPLFQWAPPPASEADHPAGFRFAESPEEGPEAAPGFRFAESDPEGVASPEEAFDWADRPSRGFEWGDSGS